MFKDIKINLTQFDIDFTMRHWEWILIKDRWTYPFFRIKLLNDLVDQGYRPIFTNIGNILEADRVWFNKRTQELKYD